MLIHLSLHYFHFDEYRLYSLNMSNTPQYPILQLEAASQYSMKRTMALYIAVDSTSIVVLVAVIREGLNCPK